MMDDDKGVYFTSESKDNLGHFHIVANRKSAPVGSDGFEGLVRIHDSGERFTVISKEERPNDDREAEVAGIAFLRHSKTKLGARALKLVLPTSGKANFPISKRWSLSRVASAAIKGAEIDPRFTVYDSGTFQTKMGSLPAEVGNVAVVRSCKNFLIRAPNEELIFLLYKIADGMFKMQCRYPITPYIGFGLSVAIITSKK
jgi:hypothetical protein